MATVTDILDFEEAHPQHRGRKEDAIWATFDVSPARYYQLLGRALDTREALEYKPMLVKRLRRLRDQRATVQRSWVS